MFAAMPSLEPNAVVRLLAVLRAAAAILIGLAFAAMTLAGEPIAAALWAIPAALLAFDAIVLRRDRDPRPAASGRIARHLAFDSAALFTLFWATGGATNPFVSLFLVPIALAGVTLERRHVAAVSSLCIVGYSVLLLRYLEHADDSGRAVGFERHVVGMWLNFVLAAVLLCVCLWTLAELLRRRERELAAQRERLLRDDAVVSVATVAAGAAHALNTPLATIAVAAESIDENPDLPAAAREEIAAIRSQVELCGHHLRRLVAAQDRRRSDALTLGDYAAQLLARWRTRRPEIETRVYGAPSLPGRRMYDDQALTQALLNLLDNAGDASLAAGRDTVVVSWHYEEAGNANLTMTIDDEGILEDPELLNRDLAATTKAGGLGLGLVLARASIVRLGGQLRLTRCARGTTRAVVRLPVAALEDSAPS